MKKIIGSALIVSTILSSNYIGIAQDITGSDIENIPLSDTLDQESHGVEFDTYGFKVGGKSSTEQLKSSSEDISALRTWNSFPKKQGVSIDKDWTIVFSRTVSLDKIDGMVIERVKGNTFVPVRINLFPAANQAKITPISNYIPGEEYSLKIFLTNGNHYKMDFTVEEERNLSAKRGNSVGNITNGGYMAEYEGWIYYSNPNDGGKLYKVKPDGSKNTKLLDDSVSYINVSDGWVYVGVGTGRNALGVVRVRLDGTSRQELYIRRYSEGRGFRLSLMGNRLYYMDSASSILRSARTDGTASSQIRNLSSGSMDSYFVDGNWIYYSNSARDNKLHKVSVNGDSDSQILNWRVESLNLSGDWIYFISKDDRRIYKVDKQGHNPVRVVDQPSRYLNVHENYVYYTNDVDRSIYRIAKDGSGSAERINDIPSSDINIVYDWIFYRDPVNDIWYRMKLNGAEHSTVSF